MEMEAAQDVKPKNLFPRQPSFSFSSSSLPKEDDVLKMTQTTTTRYVYQVSNSAIQPKRLQSKPETTIQLLGSV
ncbi:hypothetical protein F2Q68_00040875 [Brassica cretica]|uniref:Uncharacterized protein n=1 Tax=Brassica cretica TaxID=69181 RepID=A0A8S9MIJ5_BRACR|nr:hypothetical protein F2Q68_00040875 [Brassica cretica]